MTYRTRIKICGLSSPALAIQAAELGVDAVGLVLATGSPRSLSPDRAAEVAAAVSGLCWRIGLFRNQMVDEVEQFLTQVPLDLIQFHGDEDACFCELFGRPYIKALSFEQVQHEGWAEAFPGARGFIVDGHAPGEAGGAGQAFDWSGFPGHIGRPILLAGGLNPGNVYQAIVRARPYGVDVSSGVECEPGVKDAQLMKSFVEEVRRADGA
jgi:phosphoribosylanthranilate isomerase